MILYIVILLLFFLIGYILGKRVGEKTGYKKGLVYTPIKMRIEMLKTRNCPLCKK